MKIEIVKYKCDVCGRTFDAEKDIRKESVPCYGEGTYPTSTKIDMCNKCSQKLREIIYDNFAEIRDDYGVSIKKKFKEVQE